MQGLSVADDKGCPKAQTQSVEVPAQRPFSMTASVKFHLIPADGYRPGSLVT
jgi:hypothetical protein|tara:strand:- start:34431 stop:34586 length:156 start_codon:yes stop_codon:yes gene_type:complete